MKNIGIINLKTGSRKENNMDTKEKVVVVTGSSSGIGEAIAHRFAKEGARVVVNSHSSEEAGRGVAEEIVHTGGKAVYIQADVADEQDVKRLFQETLSRFGTVDILINNAGQAKATPFLDSGKAEWIESFDTNLFSAVLCSKEAAQIMLEKSGGCIINTASIRGLDNTGREGIIAYSAAKAAMINFTKTLAKQLAPTITVNAIAPGFVKTPAYRHTPSELQEGFIQSTLIKRWIDGSEIADACHYIASASAITGIVLVVDGGFTLKVG